MGLALAGAALAVLLWLAAGAGRRARARILDEMRAAWGQPRNRPRSIDLIADYHRARAAPETGHESVDSRTWDDLQMDAVFAALDRTESTLGQQVLYHRLRSAPAGDLDAFEALIDRMATDVAAREQAQLALSRLRNPAGYDLWWLAQPGSLENRPWHAVFPIVAATMLVPVALAFVWPGTLFLLLPGVVLNLYIRVVTATRIGALVGSFRQVGPLLAAGVALKALSGPATGPILGSLVDDLKALARLGRITRWVARDPIALGELVASLFEYLNLLFLLDANALYFGARELSAHGPSLLRVLAAVGEIDAALSVASVRQGTVLWTRPIFTPPGSPADFAGLRHPLVEDAVPNSIVLGPPYGVLITGSNMSGKSTFLRTVGVNVILSQTIHTCFGSAYEAPILRVRSCIGRSDDLLAGKSYYLVEVESVLSLVHASADSRPHLFLLDELFRGTNAVERIAAAEAVLGELVGQWPGAKPHLVIAATHDGELVDLLRDAYQPFHLTDSLGAAGLVFEYRLRRGPATTRNAIALLRLNGAPAALVNRALHRAARLDEQRNRAGQTVDGN